MWTWRIWAGSLVLAFGLGCGDSENDEICSLGGDSCDAFAFYKVTEDQPIFEEPGPHGYMLLVRARVPDSDGVYFEFAEQGRKESSGEASVILDDPRGMVARSYPPLAQLLVPASHPRGIEGSPHWYGWGEVSRSVDFSAERVTISFGPMTFLNQTSGEEWTLGRGTEIEVDLDVLCWTPDKEPAPRGSEFCARQMPTDSSW